MRLSRKDFSLFQFFVSLNLMEPSRFLSRQNLPGEAMGKVESRFVMFGYEKTGVPPTTYSINFSSDSVKFQFVLDEDESDNRKVEGVMDVTCSNASWSLLKVGISKQRASVASICLTQTSNIDEWGGFPDLLLPSQASIDDPACLLEFTSTTYPNGNNAKTLNIDQACIYMIIPAWINVLDFFKHLPTSPEIFSRREVRLYPCLLNTLTTPYLMFFTCFVTYSPMHLNNQHTHTRKDVFNNASW